MQRRVLVWLLGGLATLIGLFGLGGLHEDGAQAFRLEHDSPLVQLNAALVEKTGGDRLVLAMLRNEAGLLDEAGVAAIEQVRGIMAATPGITRVQAVHVVPLLESVDGTVKAVTPLSPPPADSAGWAAARSRVLNDPLLRDQLISADGKSALVVGWVQPIEEAEVLAAEAQHALRNETFRSSPAGQRIQQQINAARMAVALGEVSTSPQAEVGRRLSALLTEGGPGSAELARWQSLAEQLQHDPDAAVLSSLEAAVAELAPAGGTRVRLFSPRMLQDGYADAFRDTMVAFVAVLLLTLLWFVARRRGLLAAGVATLLCALCMAASLGGGALLGLQLHPLTALAALSGGLWLAVLLLLRPPSRSLRLLTAAVLGAPILLALPGGPALNDLRLCAAVSWVLAVLLAELWAELPFAERSDQDPPSALYQQLAQLSVPWAWLVVLCCSLALLLSKPIGLDVGRLVGAQVEVGETCVLLGRHFGAAPGAFLVLSGSDPNTATQPASLRALADAQQQLSRHPAVRSVVSWSDFVSVLHGAVAGAEAGTLPSEASLVEQYLLLFDRPEISRMLVSEDRSMAVAVVRTALRGGAELGHLEQFLPAGAAQPALAGEAVAMSLSVRRQAQGLALGAVLAALLLVAVLLRLRSRGATAGLRGGSLAVPVSAASLCLAAAAYIAGAIGAAGVVAAGWVLGALGAAVLLHAVGERRGSYDLFQLLAISGLPLAVSLAMPLRAMGVGLVLSALLATFLFEPGVDEEPVSGSDR